MIDVGSCDARRLSNSSGGEVKMLTWGAGV